MAPSPRPSTPDNKPPRPLAQANRSFTLPAKFSTPPAQTKQPPAEVGSAEDIETLYDHLNARVFKFTTSPTGPATSSPGRPQSSGGGSLPWATPTERTITVGPIQVYRHKTTLMSFMYFGGLLQPILRRTQCWCVDGTSKFAFRSGPDTYFRIELPGESEEDLQEVEEFKAVLGKVLFFERTPCPFARTFSVELPPEEERVGEVKRRRKRSSGVAKKWKLDSAYGWRPEGWTGPETRAEGEAESSGSQAESEEEESESASGQEEVEEVEESPRPANAGPSVKSRAAALRTAGVPQPAVPQSMPTSKLWMNKHVDGTVESAEPIEGETGERESSRLRTFQAIPTDMPPSPPDSSAGLDSYPDGRAQAGQEAESERAVDDEGTVDIVDTVNETSADFARLQVTQSDTERLEDTTAVPEDVRSKEPPGPFDIGSDGDAEKSDIYSDPSVDSQHIMEDTPAHELPTASEDESVDFPSATVEIESQISPPEDQQEIEEKQLNHPSANASDDIEPSPPEPHHESQQEEQQPSSRPTTPPNPPHPNIEDPYAAIQARILARRSLSGTTSFHPLHKSPTRSSTSSTSSTGTIISNASRKSTRQQQDAFATAMVRRLLGPPAHLVSIMLQIAARFANGALGVGGVFYVESPVGERKRVPGGFAGEVEGEFVEGVLVEDSEGWEDEEDDFGVLLNRPVADLGGLGVGGAGVRERVGIRDGDRGSWDVD